MKQELTHASHAQRGSDGPLPPSAATDDDSDFDDDSQAGDDEELKTVKAVNDEPCKLVRPSTSTCPIATRPGSRTDRASHRVRHHAGARRPDRPWNDQGQDRRPVGPRHPCLLQGSHADKSGRKHSLLPTRSSPVPDIDLCHAFARATCSSCATGSVQGKSAPCEPHTGVTELTMLLRFTAKPRSQSKLTLRRSS